MRFIVLKGSVQLHPGQIGLGPGSVIEIDDPGPLVSQGILPQTGTSAATPAAR